MDKNIAKNVYENAGSAIEQLENADTSLFPRVQKILVKIPVFLIVPIVYVVLGMLTRLWHPLWLMFFLIPIHLWLCLAFKAKSMKGLLLALPIPLLAVLVFLGLGLFAHLWKIAWLVFLLIPLYYWLIAAFVKKK